MTIDLSDDNNTEDNDDDTFLSPQMTLPLSKAPTLQRNRFNLLELFQLHPRQLQSKQLPYTMLN
jgi:hypothetical protein